MISKERYIKIILLNAVFIVSIFVLFVMRDKMTLVYFSIYYGVLSIPISLVIILNSLFGYAIHSDYGVVYVFLVPVLFIPTSLYILHLALRGVISEGGLKKIILLHFLGSALGTLVILSNDDYTVIDSRLVLLVLIIIPSLLSCYFWRFFLKAMKLQR